jgi:hypothetical protein
LQTHYVGFVMAWLISLLSFADFSILSALLDVFKNFTFDVFGVPSFHTATTVI